MIMVAILLVHNNEAATDPTAILLLFQTNPAGVELFLI